MYHSRLPPPSPPSSPTLQNEETYPKVNWEKLRKDKLTKYALDQMGLSSLQTQAEAESDGETDYVENIQSEEEVERDYEVTVKNWDEEYVQSVRIQQAMKVTAQNFIKDLISSSLTIMEQEDHIGISYTTVQINSGELTLDWAELFEEDPTRINQLTVCLAYASIFIPATGGGR